MNEWVRIPFPIDAEEDRRSLCAILVSAGLSVRVVKARCGTSKNPPDQEVCGIQPGIKRAGHPPRPPEWDLFFFPPLPNLMYEYAEYQNDSKENHDVDNPIIADPEFRVSNHSQNTAQNRNSLYHDPCCEPSFCTFPLFCTGPCDQRTHNHNNVACQNIKSIEKQGIKRVKEKVHLHFLLS